MSERITEAELLYWETRGGPQQRLVAEVRRLQGLIVATHGTADIAVAKTALLTLFAEARAIRDEQTVGFAIPTILGSPDVGEPRVQWAGIPADAEGVKRIYINGKSFVPEA